MARAYSTLKDLEGNICPERIKATLGTKKFRETSYCIDVFPHLTQEQALTVYKTFKYYGRSTSVLQSLLAHIDPSKIEGLIRTRKKLWLEKEEINDLFYYLPVEVLDKKIESYLKMFKGEWRILSTILDRATEVKYVERYKDSGQNSINYVLAKRSDDPVILKNIILKASQHTSDLASDRIELSILESMIDELPNNGLVTLARRTNDLEVMKKLAELEIYGVDSFLIAKMPTEEVDKFLQKETYSDKNRYAFGKLVEFISCKEILKLLKNDTNPSQFIRSIHHREDYRYETLNTLLDRLSEEQLLEVKNHPDEEVRIRIASRLTEKTAHLMKDDSFKVQLALLDNINPDYLFDMIREDEITTYQTQEYKMLEEIIRRLPVNMIDRIGEKIDLPEELPWRIESALRDVRNSIEYKLDMGLDYKTYQATYYASCYTEETKTLCYVCLERNQSKEGKTFIKVKEVQQGTCEECK